MAAKLDRSKPFGTVFGIHEYGAVYEQFGKSFDAEGNEVGPGITKPVGDDAVANFSAAPAPVSKVGEADVPPADDGPDLAALEAELKGLHPAQVAKLVTEAGLTPAGGKGAKAMNIKLLLDNAG